MSACGDSLPAWKAAIRAAADRAFDANPGSPDLPPEVTARIRRTLFRPPAEAEQAA